MDTSEIVVSSIRAGMKREFAFMMKAQSEMGGVPVGRRVTRSQSVSKTRRGYVVSDSKINKKMKGSVSKKLKKNEEEKPGRKYVGKLEPIKVLNGENGAERGLVDALSNIGDCSRNLEADLSALEGKEAEKVGVVSDSKVYKKMKGSASKKSKKNEEEKPEGEYVGKLKPINVLDGENGGESGVVDVGSNMGNCSRNLEADLAAVDGNEEEKAGVVSDSEICMKVKESASKKLKITEEEKPEGDYVGKLEPINVLDGENGGENGVVDVGSNMGGCSRNLEADLVAVESNESEKVGAVSGSKIYKRKKLKRNEEEKPERECVGKLEPTNILDGENGAEIGVVDVVSNMGDCSKKIEVYLDAVEGNESEKVGVDYREGIHQSFCTDSPVAQVGGSDQVSTHEDGRILSRAFDLGSESTREGTSMVLDTPLRRFTRSALKLPDGEIELRSGAGAVDTLTASPSKLEMKMSKKIGLKRIPGKLKDLLETGLLEGLRVRYVSGSKGRRRPESELQGVIKGTGILCSCDECEGKKVVTPNQFELHARSGNKRPPEYIYLENGKSLRDVLNACKANLSDSLEGVIQNAIGRSNYTTAFCLNCRGLIPEAGAGRAMLLCDSCVLPKESGPSQTVVSDVTNRSPLVASSPPFPSSCLPEVVDSAQITSSSQPQVKSQGKLTRKDLRMHKSVLAEELLPDGTALSYVMHGKIRLEGYKKDSAIFCFCCKKVVSPSQFEAHAGFASRRKPYMSIYTSNGVSLHQLSLELSRSRKSSTEENDDLCSICEDGGDLLCCENCPRAFHTECVGLSSIPQGAWYCKYCLNMFEKEKFAEHNANAIAAGRVPGVDPLEDISRRCIRIVANFEKFSGGGCIICRVDEFSKSGFNDHTVMICDQCEREYHVKCLREQQIDDLKALPETEWFCSKECSSIHSILQKLISDDEPRLPDAVLNILEKKGDGQDSLQNPKLDVRWRLLRGKVSSEDTRAWLSGAVTIFHDRFDPIADASTSRLDLIPTMVYGRKFKDQEFYGMYCAILTVDSTVVSAAIVRVFGEEVAELPLVATRSDCQGKGYFQALFVCIEDLLLSLNVKDLVLPAADEAESLWKNRFGFEKLDQEKLDEYKKSYQLMIFEGTSVLHKLISKS